jgi:hypothetical protein
MLRLFASCLEVLATIFALLSPVAILHWLVRAAGGAAVAPYLQPLNVTFDPLNHVIDAMIQLPHVTYNGQDVSITQGIQGALLTGLFFLCSAIANQLKKTDQQADVLNMQMQYQARKRLQAEQARKQNLKMLQGRTYFAFIDFPFLQFPQLCAYFENYTDRGGTRLEVTPQGWFLQFQELDQAIQYADSTTQRVTTYYSGLRPLDPQPPFKIGIHAEHEHIPQALCMEKTAAIVRFAQPHKTVLSLDVAAILRARASLGQSQPYLIHSLGYFCLSTGQDAEIFQLTLPLNAARPQEA